MKFLLMIQIGFLYMAAALDISDDARVEITCTGRGDGSLPQWSINDKIVAAYAPAVLRSLGIAITPERIDNAIDENNNVFQTLVINGSASIRGTTVECVFEGEMIFPTTELVYLAALPPPENLTVSEGGLVQWQPPYSSLETEAVRYFLYNVRYSVEVTDTLTQETIMYNETTDTSFSFQPPADCIEDTVTVTARGATSVGDPAAVNMTLPTYEIPEPVDAERINATLQGNTLTVIVTAQYELTCRSATNFSIIYNGQYYNMSATLEIELIVGACSFDVVASNPAGNSDPTRVPINDCDGRSTSEVPTLKFETSNQNIRPAVIAGIVVAVTVGVVLLFLAHVYVTVPGVLLVVWRIRNLIIKYLMLEKVYTLPSPETLTIPRTNSTSCDSEGSPPSSPLEEPNNEKYDLVKPEEVSVLKQKTKCVQPPDEGVIYSGIQHPKQHTKPPVYADVALKKPKCSPPADGSAEPVLYSLVQLQEQV